MQSFTLLAVIFCSLLNGAPATALPNHLSESLKSSSNLQARDESVLLAPFFDLTSCQSYCSGTCNPVQGEKGFACTPLATTVTSEQPPAATHTEVITQQSQPFMDGDDDGSGSDIESMPSDTQK